MSRPVALTVAGSDSGGGAGIQADLKTFQTRGVFGASVIVAVTAQNTRGVSHIEALSRASVLAQIEAVAEDFEVAACKIGMVGSAEAAATVAEGLRKHGLPNVVLDPVMVAKGGAPLLEKGAISALETHLLPLAKVITPNLPEAEELTGLSLSEDDHLPEAARRLQAMGAKNVLLKGGHRTGKLCHDWAFLENGEHFVMEHPRIDTPHTHGTGCTLSACLAAELAKGQPLKEAIRTATDFVHAAIASPLGLGAGHGPLNLWAAADV